MNQLYNTQKDFSNNISNFLKEAIPNIRKSQLKIIPNILLGMILSESVVAHDISLELKNDFCKIQHDSVIKRIRRFFKNKLFDPYTFYDAIISYVIYHYKKKHNDKRVHITFDHMFSHNNYTVFMITMRVGKQGIPLWFRCFKGKEGPDAYEEELLKQGISYVSNLFGKDFDLIFLADRWFNSTTLLQHIQSLGHTFCIRLKRNIKALVYNQKEGHHIWYFLDALPSYKYHSKCYEGIYLTESKFQTNLVISKSIDVSEPWIIVTNGNPRRAIKDYGYRFGSIESLFKCQKSNGFNLEKTVNASLKYFESMYTIACFAHLFLTIIAADYSKNTKNYRNVKFTTHTKNKNNGLVRLISLFQLGLTLFKRAFNSSCYIKISYRFILYDI